MVISTFHDTIVVLQHKDYDSWCVHCNVTFKSLIMDVNCIIDFNILNIHVMCFI